MDHIAAATITKGKLVLRDRDEFTRALRRLPDGDVWVTVAPMKDKRSEAANHYYFGVVLKYMAVETGDTKDELHDEMCARFLGRRIVRMHPRTGEVSEREIPGRSSALSSHDFFQFVEQVRQFALEFLNVTTPDPDPEYRRQRARAEEAAANTEPAPSGCGA